MLPRLDQIAEAAAIVYSFMRPTPQYCWPLLCRRVGAELWLKHEYHTPIGAFKIRGGLVYFDKLAHTGNVRGVISATRGNHGQSVGLAAKRPVDAPAATKLADGMACRSPQPEALEVIWRGVDRIVEVTDGEVAEAIRIIFECTHNTAEGAGAAAVAAVLKEKGRVNGKRVAAVLSGGNIDRKVFADVLISG